MAPETIPSGHWYARELMLFGGILTRIACYLSENKSQKGVNFREDIPDKFESDVFGAKFHIQSRFMNTALFDLGGS